MHVQTATRFGTKRLWLRTVAGLLSGCLVLGTSSVSQATEPAAEGTAASTESSTPVAADSDRDEAARRGQEGQISGRAVAGGFGAVMLLLGTGLTGAGIYLGSNAKGSAPKVSSDLGHLGQNLIIPLGVTCVVGGVVMIGAVARRRAH